MAGSFFTHAKEGVDQDFRYKPVDKKYLHIPVKAGEPKVWVSLYVNDRFQYDFEVELASSAPDYFATVEIGKWKGEELVVTAENVPSGATWREWVNVSDAMSDEETVYTEKYRPQFHFSPRRGWVNDPNGLIYYKGVYHLFFQHNPFGTAWGNMTWGHAVSDDLIHWKELPDALLPDENGLAFSGSAVVDWNNTSGLQPDPVKDKNGKITNPPLVVLYTSHGPGIRGSDKLPSQSLAYSLDDGMTWIKYPGNPVLPSIHPSTRDPKIVWYQESETKGHWVMALYMIHEDFALFTSDDLIHWEKTCDVPHLSCIECPDLFELPVDGDKRNTRWVFWGANSRYVIGTFDGKVFSPESDLLSVRQGDEDYEYAAQTFSDIPEKDGRRIQMAWVNSGTYPGMPFCHQLSMPRSLTLRTTPNGIRLFTEPVKEVEKLRRSKPVKMKGILSGEEQPVYLKKIKDDLVDMTVVFDLKANSGTLGVHVKGLEMVYDIKSKTLDLAGTKTVLEPVGGKIEMRFLLDRMSVELYANDGRVSFTKCFVPGENTRSSPFVFGTKEAATFQWTAYELSSIWQK